MISVKNLKFILSLIFFEKDLDMVFNNVLNKKGFSRLQILSFSLKNT